MQDRPVSLLRLLFGCIRFKKVMFYHYCYTIYHYLLYDFFMSLFSRVRN